MWALAGAVAILAWATFPAKAASAAPGPSGSSPRLSIPVSNPDPRLSKPALDADGALIGKAGRIREGARVGSDSRPVRVLTNRAFSTLSATKIPAGEVAWPDVATPPPGEVSTAVFAPGATVIVPTTNPEFSWPEAPGAASYRIYVSSAPFNTRQLLLAREVKGTSYRFDPAHAVRPLADGQAYSFIVLPVDAGGRILGRPAPGFFSTIRVVDKGSLAADDTVPRITGLRFNGVPVSFLQGRFVYDLDKAPDGRLAITGAIARPGLASSARISLDNGATWSPLPFDPANGAFNFEAVLSEGREYRLAVEITSAGGQPVRMKIESELTSFSFVKLTERGRLRKVLDELVAAYLANDRRALMALIDRDYISSEPDFRDIIEFENSIRDQFNKTTTSFCRWSTDAVEVVIPGRRVELSFTWRQTINFNATNSSRDFTVTARFDMRQVDGVWKIREDLDRKIFVRDFGVIPAPPNGGN